MDINVMEVLDSFKQALDLVLERVERQDEMIQSLISEMDRTEEILFDGIINPANAIRQEEEYNSGLEDFRNKYGEKFEKYGPAISKIDKIDDYDITKDFFDVYNGYPEGEKVDTDTFVEQAIAALEEQLAGIKEALGLPADAPIEIEQDENGDVQVKADGENVADSETETETETEEPVDEMAQYEEELKKYLK